MHGGLYAYQLERKLHGKIEEVTNGKREGEREREKKTQVRREGTWPVPQDLQYQLTCQLVKMARADLCRSSQEGLAITETSGWLGSQSHDKV